MAKWLETDDRVAWVNYPGLPSHPTHANAQRYLAGGSGGIITFGVRRGADAGRTLINSVKLFSLLANVGDAKSLIIHPASTTHQQLDDEGQRASGVTPDLVRLSVPETHRSLARERSVQDNGPQSRSPRSGFPARQSELNAPRSAPLEP